MPGALFDTDRARRELGERFGTQQLSELVAGQDLLPALVGFKLVLAFPRKTRDE